MTGLARMDGLTNIMTGLGTDELDMRQHTTRSQYTIQRSVHEYEAEFAANWMANREISQPAGDMFREGIQLVDVEPKTVDLTAVNSWIEGDTTPLPDGSIDRKHGILYYAQKLWIQGPKVGGAALHPVLDDGMDPSEPLDWRRIRRIVAWEVFDRSEIVPFVRDTIGGEPEYYLLSDALSSSEKLRPGQVIHRTRLFVHKGRELGRREMRLRNYWGDSWLELNWSARRAVEEGRDYGQTYLDRSSWIALTIGNLAEIMSERDHDGNLIGQEYLNRRMRQFRRIARTLGIAVVDGGKQGVKAADGSTELEGRNADKVESIVEGTGDIVPIVEMNKSDWQSGIGMPRSIAFGEQSSALRGGENTGDWQSWQGTISGYQASATALVNWMLSLVFASREGPTNGLIPRWSIVWNPLIVPTAMEKAQIAKAQAEADNARIEKGVAEAEEVRLQRLVQGDVTSPLTASAAGKTSRQPVLVGIANAVLTGAQMVADGLISEQLYALYLTAIDEQRFPPEVAARMARAAAASIGTAASPDAPAVPQSKTSVSPATVMNAGSLVAQGKMTPEFFRESLVTLDPATFPPDVADRLTEAAMGGVEQLAAEMEAAGIPDQPLGVQVPEETADAETDLDGDGIPDPLDAILAEIPKDLMTPDAIVAEIKAQTNLDVTTRLVHSLAKRYGARGGRVGKVCGFSLADIKAALAKDNGLTIPDPVTET